MSPFLPMFAQTAAPAAGGTSTMGAFLFQIVAFIAIIYFIILRPQQKQRKQHEAAILTLRKGDEIVTTGGIVGEVVHIKEGVDKDGKPARTFEDRVTIRTGESKVVIERGRIAKIVSATGGESTAS